MGITIITRNIKGIVGSIPGVERTPITLRPVCDNINNARERIGTIQARGRAFYNFNLLDVPNCYSAEFERTGIPSDQRLAVEQNECIVRIQALNLNSAALPVYLWNDDQSGLFGEHIRKSQRAHSSDLVQTAAT